MTVHIKLSTVEVLPRWSARRYTPQDLAEVLNLFTEPEFFFRTRTPDSLAQCEVVDLLGDDTMVMLAYGRIVGLYALEYIGADHASHYLLTWRLRRTAPDPWWESAFREIVRALRDRTEVVRITVVAGGFDERGLRVARDLGLTEEGTLEGAAVHEGGRHGLVYFSRIWTVRP